MLPAPDIEPIVALTVAAPCTVTGTSSALLVSSDSPGIRLSSSTWTRIV
jgi:hypothetical protein